MGPIITHYRPPQLADDAVAQLLRFLLSNCNFSSLGLGCMQFSGHLSPDLALGCLRVRLYSPKGRTCVRSKERALNRRG